MTTSPSDLAAPSVTLTRDELIFGAQGAVIRNIDALLKGRTPIFGNPQRELWVNNIVGALAECAVAKFFGRYWTPCYDAPTGVADVGKRMQVRSSTNEQSPLRVYERDQPDHAFVLVIVRAPVFTLAGWMWGHEAKADEWERAQGDATDRTWCVPQSSLREVRRS